MKTPKVCVGCKFFDLYCTNLKTGHTEFQFCSYCGGTIRVWEYGPINGACKFYSQTQLGETRLVCTDKGAYCDIWVGGYSTFHNPFPVGGKNTQYSLEKSLELYEAYLRERMNTYPDFRQSILECKGKILGDSKPISEGNGQIILKLLKELEDAPQNAG